MGTIDWKFTSGVTTYTECLCFLCKKGYSPSSAHSVATTFFTVCTKGNAAFANCMYQRLESTTTKCFGCNSGYSINNAGTSCASTTDNNCNTMDSTDSACQSCWSAYYFNGTACKKNAQMTAFVMGVLALVMFFFN